MADGGELAAAFRALAGDAAEAGEDVGNAMGRWFGDTADIEDENVSHTLAADAENARALNAIRPDPGDLAGGTGGAAAGSGGDAAGSGADAGTGGAPNRIGQLLSGEGDTRSFGSNPEGAAYGQSTWKDAQDAMTPDERTALRDYSNENPPGVTDPPDYKDINGYLRGQRPGTPEVIDHVASMDRALTIKPVPENLEVIRETGASAFDRPVEMLPGSVQREPAYLSTALGPDPTFDPTATKPVLHLDVPAGTPAMYMDGVSKFPSERELLLGHGLSYQVDRVENISGRWHIYGRVVR